MMTIEQYVQPYEWFSVDGNGEMGKRWSDDGKTKNDGKYFLFH